MIVRKAYKFRLYPTHAQETLETCREVYNSLLHWRHYDYDLFKTTPSPQRRKARKVVARVHERIRNKRHNFHHQEARKIVDRYGIITVEKLNIATMSKSPAPKQDELTGQYLPNGHAAKAGLNKSILDAGWYSFRRIVTSKAESAGRNNYEIEPAFTSQDCAECGYRPPKEERKKLSDRWHDCPRCGYSVYRDKNSAVLQDKIGMGLHTIRRRAVEAPAFTPGE